MVWNASDRMTRMRSAARTATDGRTASTLLGVGVIRKRTDRRIDTAVAERGPMRPEYRCRLEWGRRGARVAAERSDVLVVAPAHWHMPRTRRRPRAPVNSARRTRVARSHCHAE